MNQSNGICNESCGVDGFLQETRCSRSVPHPTGLDWPNRFSRRSSLLRGDARTRWRVLARSAGVGRSRPVAGSPEKKLAQDVTATRIHADTKNPWYGHMSRGLLECKKIVYLTPSENKRRSSPTTRHLSKTNGNKQSVRPCFENSAPLGRKGKAN